MAELMSRKITYLCTMSQKITVALETDFSKLCVTADTVDGGLRAVLCTQMAPKFQLKE